MIGRDYFCAAIAASSLAILSYSRSSSSCLGFASSILTCWRAFDSSWDQVADIIERDVIVRKVGLYGFVPETGAA